MPLYEYECNDCAGRFERIQKFSDPIVKICPTCGGPVQKLLSSPAIQFKGTGWYVTDYAKKPTGDRPDGDKQESSSGKEGESKPSETSTETKKTTEPKQKSTSSASSDSAK
ncbi:MAG: FmdB family zinc ribbon protein [Vicinamibacterales bacterium]